MTAGICLIYSTFPSPDSARNTAAELLTARLAGCCTILRAAESHYWWDGALTQAAEAVLLCKTTPALAEAARRAIAAAHPYDCPAILTLPAQANPAFAAWLSGVTNL